MTGVRTLLALALALWSSAALRDGADRWIDRTVMPPVLAETSVEMRDRSGKLLRVFAVEGGRIRLPLTLEDVDPAFIRSLVAFEDRRFHRHAGVDPLALVRAAGQAALSRRVVSGGSTLTMQVARLLENSGTGRWHGKLRQMRLALALERRLTKRQILELYLLHAPYGGPVEGLRAASLAWFGKEPARLGPSEIALLIALPQSPETRRPDRFPEAARAARERVLQRLGQGEGRAAAPLPLAMRPFPRHAPHLTDRARHTDPLRQRHDLTLDREIQSGMEALALHAVRPLARQVSAAILVADHRTGDILAAVGSPAYSGADGSAGFVDMTRAIRSPGSTLKPLVYALAFDAGLGHPETVIDDAPVAFGRYAPRNFDGRFRGELTLREALQASLNIPPVLLTHELGPATLIAGLRRSGAAPRIPSGQPGLAVALGGVGLTLEELVALYAGLARGGTSVALASQLDAAARASRRIVSEVAAWQVGHVLADIAPPPGTAATRGRIAYKTGTSYGHRDAWAIGFDGAHVIGIWLGRPDGTPVPGAFGGDLAAPILFEAFGRLNTPSVALPPPPPDTLLLGTADLPRPLQRFRGRDAIFAKAPGTPRIDFPPDGAELRALDAGLPLKLRAGAKPLTVLVDGVPALTGLRDRQTRLFLDGKGFSRITVIDAEGRSDSVHIRLH